jgi:hypothetical protein
MLEIKEGGWSELPDPFADPLPNGEIKLHT